VLLTVIPEPGTFGLLLFGSLLLRARRKKAHRSAKEG